MMSLWLSLVISVCCGMYGYWTGFSDGRRLAMQERRANG